VCSQSISPNGLRVLVIEDCADTAESLAWLLGMWGHQVCVAHHGAGGLTMARAFHPQVVLLDVGLPDMSGLEVARQLHAENSAGQMRVVATSGFPPDYFGEELARAGIDQYLAKPYAAAALARLLTARGELLAPALAK